MMYAISAFLQYVATDTAGWALVGELILLAFVIVAGLWLMGLVWRLLQSIVRTIAGMLSWIILVAALIFLFARLARFLV